MSALVPQTDARVIAYAASRGISEILHFTTNRGLLGVFATGEVLSRHRLPEEKYVEHIYLANCASRFKDVDWVDYVNLSISRVNKHMLGSSEGWHEKDSVWWAVLGFDPTLLGHPGVYFTTTNNIYTNCVKRGTGVAGLNALFANSVEWGYRGSKRYRTSTTPNYHTTDPQAEVLYPGRVPIEWLRRIYVRDEDHIDHITGLFSVFNLAPVPVEHNPEVFQ